MDLPLDTDRPGRVDVAVVGAGVIGLSCAWRAAQRGLAVAVVDPDPGGGASYAAAGMLAPVSEVHFGEEALLRLNLASAADYPAFVAELEACAGATVGYRVRGTLAVALDGGDRAVLDQLLGFQRSLGLAVERLSGAECRRLEPMLTPGIRGGLLMSDDHSVDNRRLVAALVTAGRRAGVHFVRRQVTSVVLDAGVASGVRLHGDGVVAADAVVLAAGCRCGTFAGIPEGAIPPVRPVKGQILRLRVPRAYRPFLTRTVRGTVRGFPVYLVPRDNGEVVLGATAEELGFDERVTAGGVYELLREAHALVPGITELELVETCARLRPGSADNAPLIGPTAVPGLVLATGHYRNGVLLAPVTATAIADVLANGFLPSAIVPFSPLRFTAEDVPV